MSDVDRKRLLNALELRRKDVCEKFSWGFQLCFPGPSLTIKSFYVNEIGADVSVPVSYQNLKTLKRIAKHAERTQGLDIMNHSSGSTLHINETKIKTMSGNFMHSAAPYIVSIVTENLLGFKIDGPTKMVDIHLRKLVIVDRGQHAKLHCESEKQPGTFGVIVLKIPVVGGYSGGKINVEHEGHRQSFQFERDNDRYFSCVAFFEDCYNELEAISDGWWLAMVFHLIWKDAVEIDTAPLEFPAFIKAFNEINEELVLWSSPSSYSKKPVKVEATEGFASDTNEISCHFETPSQSENNSFSAPNNISNDSERIDDATLPQSDNFNLQANNLINPEEEERFLLFPLQEKYDNGLSFAQLRGRDRLMSHLFRSISYLDVHLAVVSQLADDNLHHCIDWEQTTDWSERVFQINEWIRSDESLPLTKQLQLDARTQLVGNIDHITCVASEPNVEVNKKMYFHSVLIIQPRIQSIRHACRYQLDAVLDYMEQKLPRILEVPNDSFSRDGLVFTLKHVISFSVKEPLLVWMDPCPSSTTNQRTSRLLDLCVELKAKQEGLDLLESMGTAVPLHSTNTESLPSGIPNLFLEGIRDEKVAKAIADFESRVSGWNTCGDLIMELITPLHIFRRLVYFSYLGLYFFDSNCLEGARMVADRISGIITKLHQTNMLSDCYISSFFYLIVTMERDPTTADQERIESFVILFRRLEVYRQCLLIIDFQTNHFHFYLMLKAIPSCQQLFRQLYEIVATGDLHSCSSMWNLTAPLFKIFVEFDDPNILQMLTDKITLPPVYDIIHRNNLLDSILLSPNILDDVTIFSELGKSSICTLLDARIAQLLEVKFLPEIDSPADENVELQAEDRIFRHNSALQSSLASYMYLVLRMETIKDLANSQRVLLMGLIVFNLTFERLCDLILDVGKLIGFEHDLHPRANELFVELCRMLIQFDREFVAKVCCQKILNVLKCFVWLKNRDLVHSLVHQTSLGESTESKNIFAEIILRSPDLISRLIPEFSSFATITLDVLFEVWVKDIHHSLLDSAPDSSQEKIYADFGNCVELYISKETKCPSSSPKGPDLFSPLFAKLSPIKSVELSLLLARLLVNIHQANVNQESVLKESATCLYLLRQIALQVVTRNLSGLVKSAKEEIRNCLVDVMIFLLWLGDQQLLLPFVRCICSASQKWQENHLVSKIVSSPKARQMAASCRYSREAFCLLLEQRINRLKMIKAKESTLHSSSNSSSSEQENCASLCSSQVQLEEIRSLHRCLIERSRSELDENN